MDIPLEKLDLIQQILLIKDEKLLEAIVQLTRTKMSSSEEVEGWEKLPDEVKSSIETSQKQLSDGEGIPLPEVLSKYRKRYQL